MKINTYFNPLDDHACIGDIDHTYQSDFQGERELRYYDLRDCIAIYYHSESLVSIVHVHTVYITNV